MNRIVEIAASLLFAVRSVVTFKDVLEVSLDCHICRRYHRSVRFSMGEPMGFCFPAKHPFPGRIVAKDVSRARWLTTVKYRLFFESEPFTDKKYPERPKPSGNLTWARLHFTVTCPLCGRSSECTTQNNLVRPFDYDCECGHALYYEIKEMPFFTWIDRDAPPL